jgi:hypothetical protein
MSDAAMTLFETNRTGQYSGVPLILVYSNLLRWLLLSIALCSCSNDCCYLDADIIERHIYLNLSACCALSQSTRDFETRKKKKKRRSTVLFYNHGGRLGCHFFFS